ncbi:hypothetical protein GALMADRAFT_258978 [Galerina marginata CBS 339.88]|uniref:F-box domain-containing protein n=1 Tax=Galerina marginata (strain CBS 339.88) TaxID=685588 RepID=A0A067S9P8_GALM3|nr:hypothetical protein GALMADRAFT_258978 [Galerina marginata CBS 339.88]
MAKITALASETHHLILSYVEAISNGEKEQFEESVKRVVDERQFPPNVAATQPGEKTYKDFLSTFPYNAALTCTLWGSIIASRFTRFWDWIAFDATIDPSPLLAVFAWYMKEYGQNEDEHEEGIYNTEFSFVVFTSASALTEVDKTVERKRVAAIIQRLQYHIHQCTSVNLKTMCASSLPSSLALFCKKPIYLGELTMDFCINDMDLKTAWPGSPSNYTSASLSTELYLSTLSLPGFVFMELCVLEGSEDWFQALSPLTDNNSTLSLHISGFSFEAEDGIYTVEKFASCLSKLQSLEELHLSNLSLSYDLVDIFPTEKREIAPKSLHLDTVSKDFIALFYALYRCDPLDSATFTSCAIPRMLQMIEAPSLELHNIIDDSKENEYGVVENSLQRVLAVWLGGHLTIQACLSFNDDLIQWLSTKVHYDSYTWTRVTGMRDTLGWSRFTKKAIVYHTTKISGRARMFPAESLDDLTLKDCVDYSASSLKDFEAARSDVNLRLEGLRPA